MRLPDWIVCWMPKKWQERHIQKTWDEKTDGDIRAAYRDAAEWVRLSEGRMASDTLTKIADDCKARLNSYIFPQMRKRGLSR